MHAVHKPTVGPIVGHTTHDQCRIWARGKVVREGSSTRAFGVVQFRQVGAEQWSKPYFNKMEPHFDATMVVALTGLQAKTRYEYRAGWFAFQGELAAAAALTHEDLSWEDDVQAFSFTSGSNQVNDSRVLAVGSCRYLLKLWGGKIFDDRGDKTFESVLRLHESGQLGKPFDALFMIGDQIYADDMHMLAPDKRVDQYLSRYRDAFGQAHLRRLMSKVPTYMILDDHEIEDNWPERASTADRAEVYPHAMHAYQIYQASHSPLFYSRADGRIDGAFTKLWYTFSDGCFDCFMMDSRTERDLDNAHRKMISDTQLNALTAWLKDGSGRVKLVVTSVPVFPDLTRDADDKWGAFPKDRAAVLDAIRASKLRNIVFLSGDVHCSFVSSLSSGNDKDFRVHSVVSSSFFWPYPHMRAKHFAFNKALVGAGNQQYRSKLLSQVHDTDNFARIEVSPNGFKTTFVGRKGELLEEIKCVFG